MGAAPEPDLDDHLWTIAVARLVFGPAMSIQAPPNLARGTLGRFIGAGINDWGGVSPVTPDYVNPEAPWPHLDQLAQMTADAGKILQERLTIYPAYAQQGAVWLDANPRTALLRGTDAFGLPRTDGWVAGQAGASPPTPDMGNARVKGAPRGSGAGSIRAASSTSRSASAAVGRMSSSVSTRVDVVPRMETVPPGIRMSPLPGRRRRLIARPARRVGDGGGRDSVGRVAPTDEQRGGHQRGAEVVFLSQSLVARDRVAQRLASLGEARLHELTEPRLVDHLGPRLLTTRQPHHLSLIHISEPTRPY